MNSPSLSIPIKLENIEVANSSYVLKNKTQFDLGFGAAKLGLKIMDIPVRYFPRSYGKSNIRHIQDGIILLKMCFHVARKIKFI
jgi:hypothetical protein